MKCPKCKDEMSIGIDGNTTEVERIYMCGDRCGNVLTIRDMAKLIETLQKENKKIKGELINSLSACFNNQARGKGE